MKKILCLFVIIPAFLFAQQTDTLQGFKEKISGEPIVYYSPLKEFAKNALLTRANGKMPILFKSPAYKGNAPVVTYEFLIGHSTGTSTAERRFDVWLNGNMLFTIITPPKKTGYYELKGGGSKTQYTFLQQDYDANNDAFGKLFITVEAGLVANDAEFKISGQDEKSNDWLMVFMYKRTLKIIAEPTNLVTNKENRRQVNIYLDNPYQNSTTLQISNRTNRYTIPVKVGYNKISLPMYDSSFTGKDTLFFSVDGENTIQKQLK